MLPAALVRPLRWMARQSLRIMAGMMALALSVGQPQAPMPEESAPVSVAMVSFADGAAQDDVDGTDFAVASALPVQLPELAAAPRAVSPAQLRHTRHTSSNGQRAPPRR